MNKLNTLIDKLCPNGVPYKRIQEIANCYPGATPKTSHKEYWEDGTIPWMSSGEVNNGEIFDTEKKITQLGFDNSSTKMVPVNSVVIALAGQGKTRGLVAITRIPLCTNQSLCAIIPSSDILPEFLLYYLRSQYRQLRELSSKGGERGGLNVKMINAYLVPVPPVAIQKEVVRLLEEYTDAHYRLIEHLKRESLARREQFLYYKDYLLSSASASIHRQATGTPDVPWLKLGEIAQISRGASPRPIKNFITEQEDGVNWIKIGDASPESKYITYCKEKITLDGAAKSRMVHSGDFILSNSMSFGRPYILQIDGCIHDGWLSISNFDEYVTSDYLYHVLSSNQIQRVMRQRVGAGGAVQNLNADIVKAISIPIPAKSVQIHISTILDSLSVVSNQLIGKLSKEIELRQTQYEYYRNNLFAFAKSN